MPKKILIVDDDPDIREVVSIFLSTEGFEVVQAEDGPASIEAVKNDKNIGLVIMDIMMPGMSGIEACRQIRSFSNVPLLFLTAKSQDSDKVDAYSEGGDDYLVKPFSQTELLMKVKSLIRRYTEYQRPATVQETVLSDKVKINDKYRCAVKENRRVPLTDKEYAIIRFFIDHRGEIVGNKDIYEGVWNEKYLASDGNTVMVHILNLRKKLEDDPNHPQLIKTVWGKGYKIE
ncbi:MAG: response regulator transcription factor [Eubacterium sp.]|jgi:two-component system OmpR family response regulator